MVDLRVEDAQAVGEEESAGPAAASVWGLVRSAQAEHPGRFVLIDTDGSEASTAALPTALAMEAEPQLAIREGELRAPRLAPAPAPGETRPFDPDSTVLLTGATGGLGYTPWTNFRLDLDPGTYTIEAGVVNFGDAFGESYLLLDAFKVSVPEPTTWALMILGFFGMGAALRRQRPQPARVRIRRD